MKTSKRIIICCDGTWNDPEYHDDEQRVVPGNVLKMLRAIAPVDEQNAQQQILYYHKGSNGGLLQRYLTGATGWGISKVLEDCYLFLCNNYHEGDDIYLFGFSRGAYIARSLCGLLNATGILDKNNLEFISLAYNYYCTPHRQRKQFARSKLIKEIRAMPVPVKFLGVWDTVDTRGAPIPALNAVGNKLIAGFHDQYLPANVENACQALAADEMRIPYKPSLWQHNPETPLNAERNNILQMWFAGSHRDIGGGQCNHGLSDLCLSWMVRRAREQGLVFDNDYLHRHLQDNPEGEATPSLGLMHKAAATLGFKPQPRTIGQSEFINEMIHHSVITRMRNDPEYRPANLIKQGQTVDQILIKQNQRNCLRCPNGHILPIYYERNTTRQLPQYLQATLTLAREKTQSCRILDFSQGRRGNGGAKILAQDPLMVGTTGYLESSGRERHRFSVVWSKGEICGLRFLPEVA